MSISTVKKYSHDQIWWLTKHTTLDWGKLKKTIEKIRETTLILGTSKKEVLKSERHNRLRLKKSLVSKNFIKKGKKLNKNMFAIKRPGTGLLPKKIYSISKFVALKTIKPNLTIKQRMLRRLKKWKYWV